MTLILNIYKNIYNQAILIVNRWYIMDMYHRKKLLTVKQLYFKLSLRIGKL